ncbi:MAG: diphthamide synthesis protein [Candidatus Altiarchaeota archaeon]|nr:diphthamide synthesis protein [Candidatus Altiarchaeota archaeon]
MKDYVFEIDAVVKRIRETGAKRVGLQFPEGLKEHAVDVASEIEEKTDAKAVIMVDPTYGACDTKKAQAENLGVDLIVHFGHTSYL